MSDTPIVPPTVPAAIEAVSEQQPKATEAQDPRFEALARKEKQLHRMRKEIESERQQLKSKITEYETGYVPKQRITEDPFGVMTEAGLTYDKLTEMLLNSPNMNDPTTRALFAKVKALEDKQTQAARAQEENQQRQYQDAVKQIGNEVKMLVSSNAAYETIKEMGMEEAVVELIEQTYNSEGILMDNEEACRQVEEHLLAEGERFAKLSKIQNRLKPKTEEPVSSPTTNTQSQAPKTITNALNAQPTKRLSEKERIARALAAFKGQLT